MDEPRFRLGPPQSAVQRHSAPAVQPDPDREWAEYVAWLDRESAAGRDPEPGMWTEEQDEPEAAWPVPPSFGQGHEADVLPPGALLAGLTEHAVCDLGSLSDNELVGVLRAIRRQLAREQYKQVLVTAEFGRRRQAAFEDALAPRRARPAAPRAGSPARNWPIELVSHPRRGRPPDRRRHRPDQPAAADPGRDGRRARSTPTRAGLDRPVHPRASPRPTPRGRTRSSPRRPRTCGPSSWPARPPPWR